MDPGIVAALIGAGVVAGGGLFKWIQGLYKTIDTKDQTITELKIQKAKLEVSGEVIDRFIQNLPPPKQIKSGDPE